MIVKSKTARETDRDIQTIEDTNKKQTDKTCMA